MYMKIRKPRKLSLYKALKIGYLRNERKQKKRLKRFGFRIDEELSNNERMVAFNPTTDKVIFIENGSQFNPIKDVNQFREDWLNNITTIPTGTFAYTPRFQDAKNAYLKAKKKYEGKKFELVGHSQSAVTINELAGKNDTGITYNGAFLKQKDNPNVTNYRTANDIVSAFANRNDMRTLSQPNLPPQNFYKAHGIDNIKGLPIFV